VTPGCPGIRSLVARFDAAVPTAAGGGGGWPVVGSGTRQSRPGDREDLRAAGPAVAWTAADRTSRSRSLADKWRIRTNIGAADLLRNKPKWINQTKQQTPQRDDLMDAQRQVSRLSTIGHETRCYFMSPGRRQNILFGEMGHT